MLSPIKDAMKEIELERESSRESTDNKLCPLATVADSNVLVDYENEECTKFIHSVNPAERSWNKLLSEASLRPSRLWAHVDLNVKCTPFHKLKNLVTYAWVQHYFELLCGTRFLTTISEVECKFTSDSMSNIKPKILSVDKALARHHERAMASAQKRKQPSGQQNVAHEGKELKKKKVERKKDEKLEELEQRVAVLVANEDWYRMEQKAEVDNLLGQVRLLMEKCETIAGDIII
ncbi:hypothetical protein ACOSQ3_028824 [Xanthoceras sorbifolium]